MKEMKDRKILLKLHKEKRNEKQEPRKKGR
jgi:hypothetical protein